MPAYAKNYGYFFNSNSGDRTYNAESFEEWLKPFFLSGVFNGEMQVLAQSTPDMTVVVKAGHANLDGKAATWESDNTMTLAVASGVYDRIDTIVLRRDNINRTISIEVVTGVASGSPQPTAPVRDADTFELVLAQILVGTGVTAITQANITDKRMDSTVCGWVAATVDQIDFDQIYEQYEQWQEDTQDYFTAWFESIRGQLDEDAAGHLQNEIDDLTADLDDLTADIDDLSTDLISSAYTINGNTCSNYLDKNRFVRLINSTVSSRPDGLYFLLNNIQAGTPVTTNDLAYPSSSNGMLNILCTRWLNRNEDIIDDLVSPVTFQALSAKQGKVLNDKVTAIGPVVLGSNENTSHNWILMRTGNLYHLHYERLTEVANGTVVHTISTSYTPSAAVRGYCYYKQTSGYAPIKLTVYADGNVQMSAVTYNENVAGVFDVFWTRS